MMSHNECEAPRAGRDPITPPPAFSFSFFDIHLICSDVIFPLYMDLHMAHCSESKLRLCNYLNHHFEVDNSTKL